MSMHLSKSFTVWLVFPLCLLLASAASANHQERDHNNRHYRHDMNQRDHWRGPWLASYLGIGLGFGGDEVGRFDDNYGYTEKIYGGGGVLLEAGVNLSFDQLTELRLTGGYQFDGASRNSGRSKFDRLRFDLTMLRRFGVHDFGIGVTAHTSVGFQCNINTICEGDVEFEHAVGYTLEYAIRARLYDSGHGSGVRLGVRYTGIDYQPRLANAERIDGDTLTGFLGIAF